MLEISDKIICSIIQVSSFFLFLKIIFNVKREFFSLKSLLIFLSLAIITIVIYTTKYQSLNSLLVFTVLIITLCLTSKLSITKSFLTAGLFMMTLILSDMLTSIVFVTFVNIEELRSSYFIYANLCVAIIINLFVYIPMVKKMYFNIINKGANRKSLEVIIFIVLLICALSIIMYIIGQNFYFNEIYLFSVTGIVLFIILAFIFFKEKYEKEKIIVKYDQLFEYVNTFEEWLDTEKLNQHEHKNQMATLRALVKNNKKAIEYIDNIINETSNFEIETIHKLKNVPKGGLKGLLCYKFTIAKNHNINIAIDVTPNVKNTILKLNINDIKLLCRIIGILLDNAIEATKDTTKKIISFEMYVLEERLNIVISNTFSGNVQLDKISIKGYSTKGNDRGKGLYFAKKISNENEKIFIENRIINDYFIQKIIIKK